MNEKLNKMYNLLPEQKFTIVSEINENLRCVICKEILVNAHQSLCGCHYCLVCIINYKNSGSKNCPGNTDECKSEDLSNISIDHRINKRISNLIVRCPHERCFHEGQLIEIEDHLRFCSKRNITCPFNNVGCEHEEMNIDKLNDHMLSEIVIHNKILIDIIGNLRNEVRELKEKEERNRKEIEILKSNDCNKNEKLELLMIKIDLIKKEKENLTDQMDICNRNLWNSLDKTDNEMKDECTNHIITSINAMEKEELSQQMISLKSHFDDEFNIKMNARIDEIKQEWSEKIEIKTEINEINKYLNMRDNGELWFQIGKLSEIDLIMSGFFYDKQNPYKIQLALGNENNELGICLLIHSGAFDAYLKWPCRANITIKLAACDKNVITKSITESFIIEKPEIELENDPQISKEIIKFPHSDLKKSKHFNKNCLLRCQVEFD